MGAGGDRLRYGYPLNRDSLVLDLGGYHGDFAHEMRRRFKCRVWIFEPVPEFNAIIRKRFRRDPAVKVFGFGLAGKAQSLDLALDGLSSGAFSKVGRRVKVRLEGAAAFLTRSRPEVVDLLKVNIEGGEFELLEALVRTGWMEKIRYLQLQFHSVVPDAEARVEQLRRDLERSHVRQWSFDWIWESWQRKPGGDRLR